MKKILISCIMLSTFFGTSVLQANERKLSASIFEIAPWGYRDSHGKISGLEYDIIRSIEKDIKEPIKINLVPYNRMIYQLKNGTTDFGIFFRSKKSEESAEPLIRWGTLDIIVITKKGVTINNYEGLSGKKIGVRLGGYFGKKFDSDKKLLKVNLRDYKECIQKFKEGKIDAVIGTAATLYYELQKQNIDINTIEKPFFISTKEDWLHFSRLSKNQHKKEKLKKSVKKLIEDGTFARIFNNYLPKKWQHD